MRLLKQFIFTLMLMPLLSFAQGYQEEGFAKDASFKNVSAGCYSAFKTAFGMLPDIADKINEDQGAEIILISNVKTPLGNPSTFSMTVDKSPSGTAEGDYKLYQKYTSNTLYLRIDLMPATVPVEQVDVFWAWVAKGFEACPL